MNGSLNQLVLRQVTQAVTLTWFENNAWRTNQLTHHNTLGAVNDEGALFGHLREVAHEHNLFFNFAGWLIQETCTHKYWRRIGHVTFAALRNSELWFWTKIFIVWVEFKFELKIVAESFDWRNIFESFL